MSEKIQNPILRGFHPDPSIEDNGKCITLLKAENKKYEYLTGYLPVEQGRRFI